MKAASDPFRVSSLAFRSSMSAAPEQTHRVWSCPSSTSNASVNIADEESSEESIGEETDRRRAVVKRQRPWQTAHRPRTPELVCGVLCELLCCLDSKPEENHEILEGCRKSANIQDLGGLLTQVGAVPRRACGGVFSIRIWRGASQAQDEPRCSSAAGSGCVWSCCLVVCLAEVCCRGRSASAGRIVEAQGTHFSGDLGFFLDSLDQILTERAEPASEDLVSTIVVPLLREASKTNIPLVGC